MSDTRILPPLSPVQARQIDQICDRFEAAWKARPRLEDYLGTVGEPVRSALLRQLLLLDWDYRLQAGDPPQIAEYEARFPGAADLVGDMLLASGGCEPPGASAETGGFTPPARQSRSPSPAAAADGPLPPRLGGYRILREVGRGGMGLVYEAVQEPLGRRVALKVLPAPGRGDPTLRERFRREAQATARLHHPNIVQIFEVGEQDGQPFLALEFVAGPSLADRLREAPQPPPQAAALVETLARAMHYAHQQGIVHRDLKPANILLAAGGFATDGDSAKPPAAEAVAKITDFGLAHPGDGGDLTASGEIVGTPRYMAPEQAWGKSNRRPVGPAADVYALGAVLYECLTGRPPFQGPTPMDTVLLVVSEEPVPPRRLQPRVPRDLETICLKCLEKEPARRYASAAALAEDLRRFLDGRTIQARPAGPLTRAWRGCKRHPREVAILGLAVLLLVGGIVGTTWGMIRAEQARRTALSAQLAEAERADGERRAREEAQKRVAQIEKGTEILAAVFRDLDPMAAEKAGVTLRDLLCRRLGEAARQLEGEAVGDPLIVARLQHPLGISLRELGHPEQAEVVLVKACRTRERLLGADHLETVATKHDLAMLYRDQGKYALAEALHKEVLAVRTAKLGAEDPDTLTTQHHLAMLYGSQKKYALAEALFKEVLAARTAKLGGDDPDTLHSQHRLALLYRRQGKYALAEALFKEVLAARTARLRADHLDTVATKNNLAALYHSQEKYALAEPLYKEVLAARTAKLGAGHPDTLDSQHRLALLYQTQEKYALAEPLYKEVLAARTARLRADHPDTLRSMNSLALLYVSMKKLDKSIPLLEETLERRKAILGPDHADTLGTQAEVGVNYCHAGRFADAIPLLEEAYRKDYKDPEGSWMVGNTLLTAYVRTGKTTAATALTTEQVRAARQKFPADSPWLGVALADIGKALLDAKAYDAAEPLVRESLSLGEKLGPDAWDTHHARSLLGGVLLGQQKYAAAEPLLRNGYEGLRQTQAGIVPWVKDLTLRGALERLVQLYDAWGRPDEAAKWRKELEAHRKAAEKNREAKSQ